MQNVGKCVYCGRIGPLTADHVPPRALWGEKPVNLLTVPSCGSCNSDASKDDEYFRRTLVLKNVSGDHPEAAAVAEAVVRSLGRPQSQAFTKALMDTVEIVPLLSPEGNYLGEGARYGVDFERLDRVVSRTVQGLYWHHHDGEHLSPDFSVFVHCFDGMPDHTAAACREKLIQFMGDAPIHTLDKNVLRYRFVSGGERPRTAWLLQFYEDVTFYAFIEATERLRRTREKLRGEA